MYKLEQQERERTRNTPTSHDGSRATDQYHSKYCASMVCVEISKHPAPPYSHQYAVIYTDSVAFKTTKLGKANNIT